MYSTSYKELAHATEEINSISFADNYYLKIIVPITKTSLKEWQDLVKYLGDINPKYISKTEDNQTNTCNTIQVETYINGLLPTECEAPLAGLITKLLEVCPEIEDGLHFEWTSSKVDYDYRQYVLKLPERTIERNKSIHFLTKEELELGMTVTVSSLGNIKDTAIYLSEAKHILDSYGLLDIQGTIVCIRFADDSLPTVGSIPDDFSDKSNFIYVNSY